MAQVDFKSPTVTLEYGGTKNQESRSVPITSGDMFDALAPEKRRRDEMWPQSTWVFGYIKNEPCGSVYLMRLRKRGNESTLWIVFCPHRFQASGCLLR
jgi:hypothetical protein